jgi:hypothetical protein
MEVMCSKCRNVIAEIDCAQQGTSHGLCEACRLELEHEDRKSATFLHTLANLLALKFRSQTS